MDDKSFYASFGFLNESFTLNEIGEYIGKNFSSNSYNKRRHKCAQFGVYRRPRSERNLYDVEECWLNLDLEAEESKDNLFECVKPSDVFNDCKPGISEKDEKLVDEFILAQRNKNTVSTTSTGVKAFTKYMRKQGEVRKIEEIPFTELCLLLSKFVVEARREDGTDFKPDTLSSYIRIIQRYLNKKRKFVLFKEMFEFRNYKMHSETKGNS